MIGKTIASVEFRRLKKYNDIPYLDIFFTDGTKITISSDYAGYTGKSQDEYKRLIIAGEENSLYPHRVVNKIESKK